MSALTIANLLVALLAAFMAGINITTGAWQSDSEYASTRAKAHGAYWRAAGFGVIAVLNVIAAVTP